MANDNNLSSLVHKLRERVAASSANNLGHAYGEDDALEIRFRAVIPNLLNAYVVPSLGTKSPQSLSLFSPLDEFNYVKPQMWMIDFAREQEGSDSCAEACWSHSEESSRSFLSRRSCCCFPCDCSYFALFR